MKTKAMNPQQAEKMWKEIEAAPELDLTQEHDLSVAGVGYLQTRHDRRTFAIGTAYLQTRDGAWLRLPHSLDAWAFDCVALAQSLHNPFPCAVRFRPDQSLPEVDVNPRVAPLWQPGVDHAGAAAAMLKLRK